MRQVASSPKRAAPRLEGGLYSVLFTLHSELCRKAVCSCHLCLSSSVSPHLVGRSPSCACEASSASQPSLCPPVPQTWPGCPPVPHTWPRMSTSALNLARMSTCFLCGCPAPLSCPYCPVTSCSPGHLSLHRPSSSCLPSPDCNVDTDTVL